MSKRELIIIVVLIVVFGGLYFLRNRDKVSYKLPESPKIQKEKVDEIVIKSEKNTFDIVKKGDKWYLKNDGIPVKKGFVDNILDKCSSLKFTALVSTSGNYEIYDLDKKAISLTLLEKGKKILDLKVGKESPTYSQTYVLFSKDPNVYQIDGNLKNYVKKIKEDIIDTRVLNFEPEEVNKIAFNYGKEKFYFEKKKNKWYYGDGKEANSDKVKEVITSLSTLNAIKPFPEMKGKIKEKPEKTITITTDKDIVLKCYGLKDKDFLCESTQYPMPFTITDTLFNTVFKESKYFKKSVAKRKKEKKESKNKK
ncbi:conserved hypothetical protein [Thermotomaculum hydrothermale]|uniref:DUF4340 domain-containing protein n=1 Tax=Thermotomaculum hydrothermale TaxID=981385 RepID=A0A7R6PLK0_9BACT|nr:DUF4340 domain-containing protein [Thermotomaculum hydrothermale]BBB31808.1 conserved hypothetical protein [Thermotomaculum hydrothermale]